MSLVALNAHGGQTPLLFSSFTTSSIKYPPQTTSAPTIPYTNSYPTAFSNLVQPTQAPRLTLLTTAPVNHSSSSPSSLQYIFDTLLSWLRNVGWANGCSHAKNENESPQMKTALKWPGKPKDIASNSLDFVHGADGTSWNVSTFWTSGKSRPEDWSDDERVMRKIPPFVLEYAPLVHLYSGEEFWPCDVAEHLLHTSPYLNYTALETLHSRRNLSNLDNLNKYRRDIYLTSDDNVEDRPDWLGGRSNMPDPPASTKDGERRRPGDNHLPRFDRGKPPHSSAEESGRSDAPAILIVVDKGHGIVDAFWFFFYSYNLGNKVLNVRFGNHVGDWEHTLVRFQDGEPDIVFFSEHYDGTAYSYPAVEKIGKRPVIYSARGTHAMYSTPGVQRYVLPFGLLSDLTDRGPMWDPALNAHSYMYNVSTDTFRSSHITPRAPTEWLQFRGHWGDKAYPLTDSRQYLFAGQYHYVSGPPGPRGHRLGREKVCQGKSECPIRHWRSEKFEWRLEDNEGGEGPPEVDEEVGSTELK